ncbi:MAG: AAA family ATPase [Anaerolineae bacterium]|nr:AAA family ATPase [Anaerolineae bacterium]
METGLTFTAWLKRKRREQGLTQEILAGLAGCSTPYLKKIEAGQRQPTRQVVVALLDALQVPKDAQPTYIALAFASPPPGAAEPLTPLIAPQTDFVGRQAELAQMRQQWAQVQQGHARIVLVSGEPGVGKTRLAHEFITHVAHSGAAVLRGGCYEYEATTPYLPFVEALRAYVRTQPATLLRQRLGPTAPEIARLAPEIEARLGPLAPNPTLPPNDERLRLFDNIARFLASVAGESGLLVFLDDLHWADQATFALLHYLLRNLTGERLLVVATYREADLARGHPLADALVTWHRERIATRIALDRLSEQETGTLLATLFDQTRVSDEFIAAIYRETEGNPFFIEEVVKSLIEAGQVYREGEGWGRKAIAELTLPRSIQEAVGRRLARLSEPCADALHIAATLGKTSAFVELAAVSQLDEETLLDALDEASAAQLLRPEGTDSFAFTHDKIRETLVEELNPVRRRRLHQRIGEALEKLYAAQLEAHAADLAYHFVESRDWGRGLAYSKQAAAKAEGLFAHDEAIKYLGLARECAQALGDREQEALVVEALGDVYAIRRPASLAVEHYTAALVLAQSAAKRAVLKARIGDVYAVIGDERGVEFLQAAERELDPETQRGEMALTLAHLGRFQHYLGQHRRAIELLEQAYALAEPLDDTATLRTIFGHLAGAYLHLARYKESADYGRRNLLLGQRKNHPLATLIGLGSLSLSALYTGPWPTALEIINRLRVLAETTGHRYMLAWSHIEDAVAQHGLGEFSAARRSAQEATDQAQRAGDVRGAALFDYVHVLIETDLGCDERAGVYVDQALAAANASNDILLHWASRWAAAYRHVQREEWPEAVRRLDEAVTRLVGTHHRLGPVHYGPTHAEAYLGLGNVAEAARLNEAHLALAREAESPHYEALALRVQGQIRAAQGRAEEAEAAFAAAIAIHEPSGGRLELGRALYHRARLRRDLGRSDAARADLARARDLFAACGAPRDLRRADTLLAHPW